MYTGLLEGNPKGTRKGTIKGTLHPELGEDPNLRRVLYRSHLKGSTSWILPEVWVKEPLKGSL